MWLRIQERPFSPGRDSYRAYGYFHQYRLMSSLGLLIHPVVGYIQLTAMTEIIGSKGLKVFHLKGF